ncbi:MAG: hypothetical protein AAFW75_33650 [Cyanobacteria bacterium J06636_16]
MNRRHEDFQTPIANRKNESMECLENMLSKTTTLGEMVEEAKSWNAGYVKIELGDKDKTTGAVVVLHGADTSRYIEALENVSDALEAESLAQSDS